MTYEGWRGMGAQQKRKFSYITENRHVQYVSLRKDHSQTIDAHRRTRETNTVRERVMGAVLTAREALWGCARSTPFPISFVGH